jgi:small-conductance mechanosensitive channel
VTIEKLTEDAANARIAELDDPSFEELEAALTAANARAEAAERMNHELEVRRQSVVARADRAESEAAALRAEVERLRIIMLIQDEPDGCARCEAVMDGHEAAPGDICHDCWNTLESRLTAANALLDEWLTVDAAASNTPQRLLDRVHAHLAACKETP